MKFGRGIAAALSILLISSIPAVSAIKPGTTCKKVDQKTVYKGKTYTCVKSGKKLVWNKGVAIKTTPIPTPTPTPTPMPTPTPTPTPIPTPTPTPTPIPTPTPTPTPIPTPTPTPTPIPTPTPTPEPTGPSQPITLDNLDPKWTSLRAIELVTKSIKPFNSEALGIRYVLSPTVDRDLVAREKAGIDRIGGLWIDYFQATESRFIYVSPEDGEWGYNLVEPERLQPMISKETFRNSINSNECAFAYGGRPYGIYTNIQCLSKNFLGFEHFQTGPHEYTHFVQFHSGEMPNTAACWIVEGMATFYGVAVGVTPNDPSGDSRARFYNNFARSYGRSNNDPNGYQKFKEIIQKGNTNEVLSIMKLLEPPGCSSSVGPTTVQIGYLLGSMSFEALVASYGQQSVVDFMADFAKTRNWKSSFKNVYSIEVEDFYKKMVPYFASQAQWS
jgi:hypothetical protein